MGEIKAAREALVEVTARLRNYMYQEFLQRDMPAPPFHAHSPVGNPSGLESVTSSTATSARDSYVGAGSDPPSVTYQNVQPVKVSRLVLLFL